MIDQTDSIQRRIAERSRLRMSRSMNRLDLKGIEKKAAQVEMKEQSERPNRFLNDQIKDSLLK